MTTKTKTKYPGITKITRADGTVVYRLIITVGTRIDHLGVRREIQQCFTFGTLTETRNKQAELRDARKRGVLVKRDSISFDVLCQRWLDSRHDIREVSRLGYAHLLKAARAQFGAEKVQDLSRADIENLVGILDRRGLAHRSIVGVLGTTRQVLDYGIASGLLSVNVAAGVKPPRKQHSRAKADTKPKTVWEWEELLRFRAVADRHEWAAAWRLTLCGLRRSEVMGLKWSAADLDSGEIRVEAGRVSLDGGSRTATDDPKSKASRRVVAVEDLQPGALPLLRALKARQAADRLAMGAGYQETGLVMVNAAGEPIRPELYSDRFRELCREAGLPVVRLHSIRDTIATKLEDLGVPPASAASLLGHTVPVYHAIYVQRTEKGAKAAASALGAVAGGVS